MVDSSSEELINEIRQKIKNIRIFPIFFLFSLILFAIGLAMVHEKHLLIWESLFFAIPLTISFLFLPLDRNRKTMSIWYDLDEDVEKSYQQVHEAFAKLERCDKAWHYVATATVKNTKYNAGAEGLVSRKSIRLSVGQVSYIRTNVAVPKIPTGAETLMFFPDRLYVFTARDVGAVSYSDLSLDVFNQVFVESPSNLAFDAKIVDKTWRYVNKKGGPDKRFRDNPELPVVEYENISFKSSTGLNEVIQLSKKGYGEVLKEVVGNLANTLGQAEVGNKSSLDLC